jgi:hypothetical protein
MMNFMMKIRAIKIPAFFYAPNQAEHCSAP